MRTNQGRRWGQALDLWGLIRWKVKHCICLHCLDEVSWLREEAGLGLSLEQPQKITSGSMSWPTEETKQDQADGTIGWLGDRATKKRELQGTTPKPELQSPRAPTAQPTEQLSPRAATTKSRHHNCWSPWAYRPCSATREATAMRNPPPQLESSPLTATTESLRATVKIQGSQNKYKEMTTSSSHQKKNLNKL